MTTVCESVMGLLQALGCSAWFYNLSRAQRRWAQATQGDGAMVWGGSPMNLGSSSSQPSQLVGLP